MSRVIQKGATDRSVIMRAIDSTDGTPETGFAYNTSGIDLWYRREGGSVVSITEATLSAVDSAHSDGGVIHLGNGYFRLDSPDAAFATGANSVMFGGTATGMIIIGTEIQLVNYNPEDGVRLGLTALPNAAADAAGGLPISDAGGLDIDTLLSTLTNGTYGLSALESLVDELESRLTATRAGYLDNLSAGAVATASALSTVSGLVDDLESRLTAVRAGYLDNLSAGAVAQASALSTIAGYLDTEIAAILEDTGTTLPAQISGLNNLSSAQAQSAAAAALAAYDPPTKAEMDAGLALLATAASIAALNNISTAQVLAQATAALNSYDPPTKAELDSAVSPLATSTALATVDGNVDSILTDTGTTIPAQIAGLNNLSSAQVTTAVDTALGTTISEPTGISDKSIKGILWHLFSRFYHKNTQTASAQTTYKANGTTVLATRTASDDGTTQTLGAAE